MIKQPITFIYRNLVFGRDVQDAWAVYRLETQAYAGLTRSDKLELLSRIATFAYGIEADFTLLRVARPWSLESYLAGVRATVGDEDTAHEELERYLERQTRVLGARSAHAPEVYLSIRLGAASKHPFERAQLHGALAGLPGIGSLRRLFALGEPRGLSARQLDALLGEEERLHGRVLGYLDCERAAVHELQWLIRRAFCRGLGDPILDERFLPQALIVDAPEQEGGAIYRPLEVDMLRLFDSPINIEPRSLRIESEFGDSHQAFLALGALPEVVPFPGRRAELLFAPLESLDFPVDAALSARYIGNDEAVRLVRRRVVDADVIYEEESHGDHGPSPNAAARPQVARALEDYLSGGDHPPLLRASITLGVSAPTPETLEDRIERLRREYGGIRLHRPLGEQLALFIGHLPGQPSAVPDYDDYLTVEQLGAMVPIATHSVGADVGPYIGHTLTGARQAVLFDPTEASRTNRAPAALLTGTLGSGKTLCMELIMYQAFLAGSSICDIDPKGDHRLERLPGVADEMEVIELSSEARFRGMLDPLRIAPEATREDLACNFLLSVLPEPVRPEWQTEVREAVQTVAERGGKTCGEVIQELEGGNDNACAAARALAIHAMSGLARLGFAAKDSAPLEAGSKRVTSLRVRNLPLPLAGTARSEMLEEERIGQAILRLLAVYALRLTSTDAERHSVLGFDEAWVLLSDSGGRALVDRISRLGRAQNVTPLLASQVLSDVEELGGVIGAAFCFGVETESEAKKAIRLLGLDEDDAELRQSLIAFRRGRCLMRDYDGRVGAIQVDLIDPALLEALDTKPTHRGETGDRAERPARGPAADPSEGRPRALEGVQR